MPGIAAGMLTHRAFGANYSLIGNFCILSHFCGTVKYDAVRVLVEAMKRAGSTDPKTYLAEVGKTNYTGVTGPIAFDDKGDIKDGAVTVYQVKGGKWEVVSTVGGPASAAPAASAAQ